MLQKGMNEFSHALLNWYEKNKRDLPWRNTKDPYKIWLSETILQQTRVAQGLDYYIRFIEKYPTVTSLASASEHEILKLWQGLGYYSRARNMRETALYIKQHYKGIFPKDYESIRNLKGVGSYTAAAIASFAYTMPYPVLDGNVMRVYARFLGIKLPVNSTAGKKKLQKAADKLLPHTNSATYNQAIMELGALCCAPKKPKCNECPLQNGCYAYVNHLTLTLPVKADKARQRERHLTYIVIRADNAFLLRHRTGKDIWKGLYDFPCIETNTAVTLQKLTGTKQWKTLFKNARPVIGIVSETHTHILSHQKLKVVFVRIELKKRLYKIQPNHVWVKQSDIKKYAVPRLIERYLLKYL